MLLRLRVDGILLLDRLPGLNVPEKEDTEKESTEKDKQDAKT